MTSMTRKVFQKAPVAAAWLIGPLPTVCASIAMSSRPVPAANRNSTPTKRASLARISATTGTGRIMRKGFANCSATRPCGLQASWQRASSEQQSEQIGPV